MPSEPRREADVACRAPGSRRRTLIDQVLHTTAHSHLLLFSNRGKVYRLRAHEVPVKERSARGTPIVNLLPLSPSESIQAIVETRTFDPDRVSRVRHQVRSGEEDRRFPNTTSRVEKASSRSTCNDGDELVRVDPTAGDDDVFMVSSTGLAIRFAEAEVRPMGRSAAGVRGMRLRAGDEVVSCDVAREGVDLLIVTDAGYGKRTKLDHFNAQVARRPRCAGHQADPAAWGRRGGAHGLTRRRDHRRLFCGSDDPYGGARDRGSEAEMPQECGS